LQGFTRIIYGQHHGSESKQHAETTTASTSTASPGGYNRP
jgi:hypothetical protein